MGYTAEIYVMSFPLLFLAAIVVVMDIKIQQQTHLLYVYTNTQLLRNICKAETQFFASMIQWTGHW